MTKDKSTALMILTCALLPPLTAIAYINRYELGIVKPAFKVGDCLDLDNSDEFHQEHIMLLVNKVGKKNYLLKFINNGQVRGSTTTAFDVAERIHTKVECPSLLIEDISQ